MYPITVEVLHQVFSPYGFVEKIVTFQKSAGKFPQIKDVLSQILAFSATKWCGFLPLLSKNLSGMNCLWHKVAAATWPMMEIFLCHHSLEHYIEWVFLPFKLNFCFPLFYWQIAQAFNRLSNSNHVKMLFPLELLSRYHLIAGRFIAILCSTIYWFKLI